MEVLICHIVNYLGSFIRVVICSLCTMLIVGAVRAPLMLTEMIYMFLMRHSRSRIIFILNSNKADLNVILFMLAHA